MFTDISDWIALAVFVALNFAAASSGAIFQPGEWYETLRKPSWTPPNWAFPLVWSVLFLANAASGFIVWQSAGLAAALPLALYVVSLGFNAAWSMFFFGLRRFDLGMLDVALLWLSIAGVAVLFWPISPLAAALQVPYLVWVSIASALNWRMMQLNGSRPAEA